MLHNHLNMVIQQVGTIGDHQGRVAPGEPIIPHPQPLSITETVVLILISCQFFDVLQVLDPLIRLLGYMR